jgi:hypothetical protein
MLFPLLAVSPLRAILAKPHLRPDPTKNASSQVHSLL